MPSGEREGQLDLRGTAFRRTLTRPVLFGAAFALLFEEWLWAWTSRGLAALTRFAAVMRIEGWIRTRSPRTALILLVAPVFALVPFKVVAFALVWAGQGTLGVAVLVADKLVVTALFARAWQLTEPAVTRIDRVRHLRDAFLRFQGAVHAWIDRQPAWIAVRDIVRRRRTAARRLRHWRTRRTDAPADGGCPRTVSATVSRDR